MKEAQVAPTQVYIATPEGASQCPVPMEVVAEDETPLATAHDFEVQHRLFQEQLRREQERQQQAHQEALALQQLYQERMEEAAQEEAVRRHLQEEQVQFEEEQMTQAEERRREHLLMEAEASRTDPIEVTQASAAAEPTAGEGPSSGALRPGASP